MVQKPLGTSPARRIRIARIITRLNVGGPAIQAMLLTARLDRERYETLLLCGTPGAREGDMRVLRREEGLSAVVIPGLGREISPLADLRAFVELVAVLRRFRPDIVHTHLAKAGLLGRLAARAVGVPFVVHTFHGNVLRGYFDPLRSQLFLTLERLLARMSTRIVAISPRQAEEIRRLRIAGPDKLVQIPLGLDLSPFLAARVGALRAELALAPAVPLIGIVARIVPIKGVDVFLEAAARIRRRRPDSAFVIVGDGEGRDELQRRALTLAIADAVHFIGWRADVASIYADCDVVVLTSHNEGTPVSLIEALAAGRAVVATAVGGVPDLLGGSECGVLVPAGDSDAVANAVLSLLNDPVRRETLGQAGRARVLAQHDATSLVRRIEALYSEMATGTHTG